MTAPLSLLRAALVAPAMVLIVAASLTGCAGPTTDAGSSASAKPSASASGPCDEVTIVVNFGALDSPDLKKCGPAGIAAASLKAAGITTAGTADYGNQVVCRVDNLPSPSVESCAKLPSNAYWALWIKTSPDAKWEYAQDGVATQQVTAGESLGLVYTEGTDSTPPNG